MHAYSTFAFMYYNFSSLNYKQISQENPKETLSKGMGFLWLNTKPINCCKSSVLKLLNSKNNALNFLHCFFPMNNHLKFYLLVHNLFQCFQKDKLGDTLVL